MAYDLKFLTATTCTVKAFHAPFPQGFPIEGFAEGDAWTFDNPDKLIGRMGVDGRLSFGYINPKHMITFHLEANSKTHSFLRTIIQLETLAKTPTIGDIIFTAPSSSSIGQQVTLINCGLVTSRLFPDAAEVLSPYDYVFLYESQIQTALPV